MGATADVVRRVRTAAPTGPVPGPPRRVRPPVLARQVATCTGLRPPESLQLIPARPSIAYRRDVTERWTSTVAGRHLGGRAKTSTAPEVALRRALHAAGFRFRLHPAVAKGCTPDLVLPRHRVAVFVDGCFWHGCPKHGRRTPWTGPNAGLWAQKMARNRERDARSTRLARDAGWTVVRVWEHEVTGDVAAVVATVAAASNSASDPRQPERVTSGGRSGPARSATVARGSVEGGPPEEAGLTEP
ncbi:very short patch repair endonuclease [Cellulosimicrobium sp. Marseille-Q8652]